MLVCCFFYCTQRGLLVEMKIVDIDMDKVIYDMDNFQSARCFVEFG